LYYGSQVVDTELWIIMEYLGGGSVSDLVRLFFFYFIYLINIYEFQDTSVKF